MLKYYKHGLNITSVIISIEQMSIKKKIIYLSDYRALVSIPLNDINSFMSSGDIKILKAKDNYYLEAMLKLLEIDLDFSKSTASLKKILRSGRFIILCFIKKLENFIDYFETLAKKKIIDSDKDERIQVDATEEQFFPQFKELHEQGYVDEYSTPELRLHFCCKDTPPQYDKEKSRSHFIIWRSFQNRLSVWINANIAVGFFSNNKYRKYIKFCSHIILTSDSNFSGLHKKYYNVQYRKTIHKDIKEIVRKSANLNSIHPT